MYALRRRRVLLIASLTGGLLLLSSGGAFGYGLHFGFGYHWPYYYPWHYPYPYYYKPRLAYVPASDMGGIDLRVKPKKTRVYVDGEYAGLVKDFDGYPGYLWLREGNYELTFALEGLRTQSESVSVKRGVLMRYKMKMVRGESTPVEQLFPSTAAAEGVSREASPPALGRGAPPPPPSAGLPGRLLLRVNPPDAVVYLDGRLLGSGDELRRLHSALVLDPGPHRLEVLRPGYRNRTVELEVASEQEMELDVVLQAVGGGEL